MPSIPATRAYSGGGFRGNVLASAWVSHHHVAEPVLLSQPGADGDGMGMGAEYGCLLAPLLRGRQLASVACILPISLLPFAAAAWSTQMAVDRETTALECF